MTKHDVQVVVIGGGVVGLATASAIAARGRSVVVVERHPRPGMETSTHNSGVIHAGLYYEEGSLKAQLCVEGAERLYAFCAAHRVPHDRCGKLVVAVDDSEQPELERLRAVGCANGAPGLDIVDREFIRRREPYVEAKAALWSPNSGRVNAHALVIALLRDGERAGGMLLRGTRLVEGEPMPEGYRLRLERETLTCDVVVNAAGLEADSVSEMLGGETFRIYPCRGEYAELRPTRRELVNGLVYPVPHPSGHGLGIHLTKTPDGAVLLGPTIRYQESKSDYENSREPLDAFLEPARRLLPQVTLADLRIGGSGIRAKLHPPGERFADFMIRPDAKQPALIHAAGIDSPGLTACLAIGERVAELIG
jgi:L-2-hydroxyglutarate oxidase LhgO